MAELIQRNLDGVYFRINREGEWINICFSDLSTEEKEEVVADWSRDQIKRLAFVMADALRTLGDQLDLIRVDEELLQEYDDMRFEHG